jgi:hypothetical protein
MSSRRRQSKRGISEPQASVSPKRPINAAVRSCDASHVAAELPLQGRRPRHQAELQAIVEHGEATGAEAQPALIDAANQVAALGWTVRPVELDRESRSFRIKLPPSQRIPSYISA